MGVDVEVDEFHGLIIRKREGGGKICKFAYN